MNQFFDEEYLLGAYEKETSIGMSQIFISKSIEKEY